MNPVKVYVTGPVTGRNTDQLNEFVIVTEKLEKMGFSVTTAADDLPMGEQRDDDASKNLWKEKRMANLKAAEAVLHIEQWEYEPDSIQEVRHSKIIGNYVGDVASFIFKYTKAAKSES